MRVVEARDYDEPRDALAHDWPRFWRRAFADAEFALLPNLGEETVDYARRLAVDGLILTGGNDLGAAPVRDHSETALLDWAVRRGLPVFGVCRGLHLIQRRFGGPLTACNPEIHAGRRHGLRWFGERIGDPPDQVNSYHRWGVAHDELAESLRALALSEDGLVEALAHVDAPLTAVMWHPEREPHPSAFDTALMRRALALP